jgi:hypothetical protein
MAAANADANAGGGEGEADAGNAIEAATVAGGGEGEADADTVAGGGEGEADAVQANGGDAKGEGGPARPAGHRISKRKIQGVVSSPSSSTRSKANPDGK